MAVKYNTKLSCNEIIVLFNFVSDKAHVTRNTVVSSWRAHSSKIGHRSSPVYRRLRDDH